MGWAGRLSACAARARCDHAFPTTQCNLPAPVSLPLSSGLALDYCVAYTCKDAARAGFSVYCLTDACRAISAEQATNEIAAMRALGVTVLDDSTDLPTSATDAAVAALLAAAPGAATVGGVETRVGNEMQRDFLASLALIPSA